MSAEEFENLDEDIKFHVSLDKMLSRQNIDYMELVENNASYEEELALHKKHKEEQIALYKKRYSSDTTTEEMLLLINGLSKQIKDSEKKIIKEVSKAPLPEKKVLTVTDFAKIYEKGADKQREFRERPLEEDPLKIITDISLIEKIGSTSKNLYDADFAKEWFKRNFASQYAQFVKEGKI